MRRILSRILDPKSLGVRDNFPTFHTPAVSKNAVVLGSTLHAVRLPDDLDDAPGLMHAVDDRMAK
jgi:hypothetical protein